MSKLHIMYQLVPPCSQNLLTTASYSMYIISIYKNKTQAEHQTKLLGAYFPNLKVLSIYVYNVHSFQHTNREEKIVQYTISRKSSLFFLAFIYFPKQNEYTCTIDKSEASLHILQALFDDKEFFEDRNYFCEISIRTQAYN